ncbi:MAG: hypothetical protein KDC44_22160, partial [Phaeodactylibacter sp.]|nr:hypothetical protein [Phaeodactylibacter sp.]
EDNLNKRMPPPPASALLPEQINLIAAWIQAGAENLECDENSGTCNTENISYANDVVPYLQTYCLSCHSGTTPSGNLHLGTYSVVAQVANDGRLYGAIAHLSGYKPMPQGSNQLPECTIDQIKAWIDAGAPQN